MMRRLLAALMVASVLAVGCSSGKGSPGTTDPVPQVTVPQTTSPSASKITKRTVYHAAPTNLPVIEGLTEIEVAADAELVIGSGDVMVSWWGELESGLKVATSGLEYDSLNVVPGVIQAHFPKGAGERWQVWLEGVPDSKITLVRKPEPAVKIYHEQGKDLTLVEGSTFEVGQKRASFLLKFDQPMMPESLERMLGETWVRSGLSSKPADPKSAEARAAGVTASWIAPDQARITFAELPAKVDFALEWLQAENGLLLAPRALLVRTTDGAPYLERVNVATGARERIMALPADIQLAHLSPDGQRLALTAVEKGPDNHPYWPQYAAMADLAGQKVTRIESNAGTLGWGAGGRLLLQSAMGEFMTWSSDGVKDLGIPQSWEASISPDGKFVVTLERKWPQNAELGKLYPVDLVITEIATGKSERVEGLTHAKMFGKGGVDLSQWAAWSPDGQSIAVLDPTEQGGSDLVVYDRATGKRETIHRMQWIAAWGSRLYWSPDGKQMLITREGTPGYLLPMAGGDLKELQPRALARLSFWDRQGARVLSATDAWAGVYVYDTNTGKSVSLGDGMPAGWDGDWAYIIRWPASHTRYQYVGI